MTAPLIGVYSPAPGSGKSTLATALVEQGWVLVKFAGPLKAMIRALLREAGCPEDQVERYVEGDLKEEPCPYLNGKTCRFAMQTLGTEWGRQIMGSDFWVSLSKVKTGQLRQAGNPVVVDDMRFPNEIEAVKEEGGKTVLLERPGLACQTSHASEGGLAGHEFDLHLVNDYPSVEVLRYAALTAVQKLAWDSDECCR